MSTVRRSMKITGASLALALGLVISGCTGSGGDSPDNENTDDQQPAKVSIFVVPDDNSADLSTNEYTLYVEDKFNLDIDWKVVPSSDSAAKQQLQLASGSYPDVFLSAALQPAQVQRYAEQGTFIPLNDLIAEYAPNLQQAMEENQDLKLLNTAPDGNIYSLAKFNYCFHCKYPTKMWVNAKHLKEFGLSLPTTTAEFENMLAVFAQHGLSMGGSAESNPIPFLMNGFAFSAGYNSASMFEVAADGTLDFTADNDQWRDGLRYINGLYSKGYLTKDIFTDNGEGLTRGIAQKKIAVFPSLCANCVIEGFGAEGTDAQYWVSVPPLAGPAGVRTTTFGTSATDIVFAITDKASKQAQIRIMQMLNEMYTTEGSIQINYGPTPNVLWSRAQSGQTGLTGEQAKYDIHWDQLDGAGGQAPNFGWGGLGPNYQSEDWFNSYVTEPPLSGANFERTLQMMTDLYYAGFAPDQVIPPAMWVDPDASQQYSSDAGNLWKFIQEWNAAFVTGDKSLDSDWQAYLDGLNSLGLDGFIETTQQAMREPISTTEFGPNDEASVKSLEMMSDSQAWEVSLLTDAYARTRGHALPAGQ